ncbi:hypothetical protein P3U10_04310 [Mammaliicoccus sciuri]|uniref:hypothetical protein n=1 Tax=Mammaliicoccus sciuri TaxID=1296 RepID=UPI002B25C849|nr:hypothetical protein [Mammaliicoccus sciuri]WQK61406.1 hypothetical protein P3U10_04310 [Mammaliicoccus sciuri]
MKQFINLAIIIFSTLILITLLLYISEKGINWISIVIIVFFIFLSKLSTIKIIEEKNKYHLKKLKRNNEKLKKDNELLRMELQFNKEYIVELQKINKEK